MKFVPDVPAAIKAHGNHPHELKFDKDNRINAGLCNAVEFQPVEKHVTIYYKISKKSAICA